MKRGDFPEGILTCADCGNIGPAEYFTISDFDSEYPDNNQQCPSCGGTRIVDPSTLEWCDKCQSNIQAPYSNLCVYCIAENSEIKKIPKISLVDFGEAISKPSEIQPPASKMTKSFGNFAKSSAIYPVDDAFHYIHYLRHGDNE